MVVDRRTLLEQLQSELLVQLDSVSGDSAARDAATLSKELRAVTFELESLAPVKESSVDELTKRRAARRAEAAS